MAVTAESTWLRDEQSIAAALSVRLNDLTFVVGQLNRLDHQPEGTFAGKLDLNNIAVAGHSLGGLSAWLSTKRQPGFKAAIMLDASLTDGSAGRTDIPVLILAMGRQWTSEECRLWTDLRGPRFAVNFQGAEHVTPSDAVTTQEQALCRQP